MWRLTATLLVVALASASPQGYVYTSPSAPVCETTTSTVYTTRVRTSVDYTTVEKVNTMYVTTTLVTEQVIPTTVYRTSVQTKVDYQTSVVQTTTDYVIDRTVTETTTSPSKTANRYVTTTRVVPEVAYVTSTHVETQVVPVEVTTTDVKVAYQPVTKYQTKEVKETYVLSTPGPEVFLTQVQTVVQTSVVQTQEPDITSYETSTQVEQEDETSVVQLEDETTTRVVEILDVTPYTTVNTCYKSTIVTNEQVITQTNVLTETEVSTQTVSKEVVRTKVVPTTIYTTRHVTRVQSITKVKTVVRTERVTPYPVVKSQVRTQTSVVKKPGYDRVVTKQVLATKQHEKIVYKTVNQPHQVTVTRTVTKACGETQTAYKYEAPAVPYHFG